MCRSWSMGGPKARHHVLPVDSTTWSVPYLRTQSHLTGWHGLRAASIDLPRVEDSAPSHCRS